MVLSDATEHYMYYASQERQTERMNTRSNLEIDGRIQKLIHNVISLILPKKDAFRSASRFLSAEVNCIVKK